MASVLDVVVVVLAGKEEAMDKSVASEKIRNRQPMIHMEEEMEFFDEVNFLIIGRLVLSFLLCIEISFIVFGFII